MHLERISDSHEVWVEEILELNSVKTKEISTKFVGDNTTNMFFRKNKITNICSASTFSNKIFVLHLPFRIKILSSLNELRNNQTKAVDRESLFHAVP